MKASEVIELLGISRPLLSYYKKMNYIRAEKIRGQYDYNEQDVLKMVNNLPAASAVEVVNSSTIIETEKTINNKDESIVLIKESLDIIKDFFYWMNKINFMGPEYGQSLETKIKELEDKMSRMS